MKHFATSILAVCPVDNELYYYAGPIVVAPNFKAAAEYMKHNIPYARVVGEMTEDAPPGAEVIHTLDRSDNCIIFLN
jgi:hypothetical protein